MSKERRKFMRITADLEGEYWAKGPSMMNGQVRVKDFSREGLGSFSRSRSSGGSMST